MPSVHELMADCSSHGSATAHRELLIPNDRGRIHLSGPPNAQEESFRPARRRLEPARSGADQGNVEGKRYVKEPRPAEMAQPERRHIAEESERSGYDNPEKTLNWTKRGRVKWNGVPAQHFISSERTLEIECGMKNKVGHIFMKRNGIPVKNLGDKCYGTVEYSQKYFCQEGLVVGSTIDDVRTKRGDDLSQLDMPVRVSYEAKKRAQMMRDEIDGVGVLTRAVDRGDGEKGVSWENRTGQLTVDSDSDLEVNEHSDDEDADVTES